MCVRRKIKYKKVSCLHKEYAKNMYNKEARIRFCDEKSSTSKYSKSQKREHDVLNEETG